MLVIVLSLLVCWCAAEGLESPTDQFQTWLLIEDQIPTGDIAVRRITPKSVFIAPPINKCPEGYRTDQMGRCVKIVKLDPANQWEFFLQKLNSMFGTFPPEPAPPSASANSVPSSNEEDRGPFQFSIPLMKQNSSAKETTPSSPPPTEAPTTSVTPPTSSQPPSPSISLQLSSTPESDLPTTVSEFSDVNTYIVTTDSPDTEGDTTEYPIATDERTTTNITIANGSSHLAPSNSSGSNSSSIDSSYSTATISSIIGAYSSAPGSNSQNSASNVYHTSPVASSGNSIVYQTSPISSSNTASVATSSNSYNSAPIKIGGSSYNIAPIRTSGIFHRSPIGSSAAYNTAPSSSSNLYNTATASSNVYNTAQSPSNSGPYDVSSSSASGYNTAPVRSSNIYNLPAGSGYNTASFSNSYQQPPASSTVYHAGSHSGNGNYRLPAYYTAGGGGDRPNLTSIDADAAAAPSSLGNTETTAHLVKRPFLIVVPNSSDYFETTTASATITTTPITELPMTETDTYPTTSLDETLPSTTTVPLDEDRRNLTDPSSTASTEATEAVVKKPFLIVVPNSSDYHVETTTQDATTTNPPPDQTTYTESTESADWATTTFPTDTVTAFTVHT
nr:PREDICTED: flocculation protein FLO11-like [Bemisia tabaci]